jgi:hypothetical protein
MQVRQGRLTPYKHTTPDERADAAQDDPQLVDAERCGRGNHALRVAQSIVPLMGSPRYLVLSSPGEAAPPHTHSPGPELPIGQAPPLPPVEKKIIF